MTTQDAGTPDKFRTFISSTISEPARIYESTLAELICIDSTKDDMPTVRSTLSARYKPFVDMVIQANIEKLENVTLAGVPVQLSTPKDYDKKNDGRCIYYIHGGGYTTGDPISMLMVSGQITFMSGLKTYSIDYRLAPEHVFPAAVEDCLAVYKELLKQYKAESIVILGDSAGGALSLVTTLHASQQNLPLPAALVLCSPWADIDKLGDSDHILEGWDCIASHEKNLIKMAEAYTAGRDLKDPDISPLYAQYPSKFPPVFIITGTRDTFLSNCARLQRVLRNAGIEVRLDVWEGMWHDFIAITFITEAQEADQEIARFIRAKIK